jgi:hypothetical protein
MNYDDEEEDFNDSDSDNSLDVIEVSDNESQCFTRIITCHQKFSPTFAHDTISCLSV